MNIDQVLMERRTIRLYQQKPIPREELQFMLEAARQTSCASNRQRLRYVVAQTPEVVGAMLAKTAWAGLVKPKRTPIAGVSGPAAFIAVTVPAKPDSILAADAGAAIQSMQLAAWSRGLGCCWIASIDKAAMQAILQVPPEREVMFVVAVGYPTEAPCSEDVHSPEQVAYYLDAEQRLHVPKLTLEELATWK